MLLAIKKSSKSKTPTALSPITTLLPYYLLWLWRFWLILTSIQLLLDSKEPNLVVGIADIDIRPQEDV